MQPESNTTEVVRLEVDASESALRLEPYWKMLLRRLLVIHVGFLIMSFGFVGIVKAGMGASPWDVFHVGLTLHTPLTFGQAQQVAGVFILILSCWMARSWPTLGCVLNIVFVGFYCDLIYGIVPSPQVWYWQLTQFLLSILIAGFGVGFYVAARLGAGPRDWLMLSLSQKTGLQIKWVRTMIEVVAVGLGLLLSGPFAIGTILFSFLIGHPTQWGIHWAERTFTSFVERRELSK